MDTLTAIHTRRSIRQYTSQDVSDDDVRILLEAAMMAPSAHNCQPWHFVVVRSRALKEAVSQLHPYIRMAKDAPLGILVCGNTQREKTPGFWVQDCAAAIQNLLLATAEIGLGAVWTGIHPLQDRAKEFQKLFDLPDHIPPLAYIVLGHPAQESKHMSRFDVDKVSFETFGGKG